jgi:hypothetical protein
MSYVKILFVKGLSVLALGVTRFGIGMLIVSLDVLMLRALAEVTVLYCC